MIRRAGDVHRTTEKMNGPDCPAGDRTGEIPPEDDSNGRRVDMRTLPFCVITERGNEMITKSEGANELITKRLMAFPSLNELHKLFVEFYGVLTYITVDIVFGNVLSNRIISSLIESAIDNEQGD